MNLTLINYVECDSRYVGCGDYEHVEGSFEISYPSDYEELYEKLKQLYKDNKDSEPKILVDGRDYLDLDLDDETNSTIYYAIDEAVTDARSDAERELREAAELARKAREEKERLAKEARAEEQRQKDLKQLAELQARYANEIK